MLVETRNRWHTQEMFRVLRQKYPEGKIRLAAGHQYEDEVFGLETQQTEDFKLLNQPGEIVGAFSGKPTYINGAKNLELSYVQCLTHDAC